MKFSENWSSGIEQERYDENVSHHHHHYHYQLVGLPTCHRNATLWKLHDVLTTAIRKQSQCSPSSNSPCHHLLLLLPTHQLQVP